MKESTENRRVDETLGTVRAQKEKKKETHTHTRANQEEDGRANAEKRDTKGRDQGKTAAELKTAFKQREKRRR